MSRLSLSVKLYFTLVAILSVLMAISVYLPQGDFAQPYQEIPIPRPIAALANAGTALLLYGGLGFIGLVLSQKLQFTNIWDDRVSARQRILLPTLVGIGMGIVLIVADALLSQLHPLGPLPHPPFPTSLVVSAIAAIGEEILFRLFLISFWVWLISSIILRRRWQEQIFWIVVVFSAIVFALAHLPSVMIGLGMNQIHEIPLALLMEIILLNGILSVLVAYYFRKFGILAAIAIHFWTDVVWHVIWGAIH